MGHQYRLRALLLGIVLVHASAGCRHRQAVAPEERKRELLKPPDVQREQAEDERKRQLIDQEGDLVPSDQIVAGVVLPRGLLLRSLAPPEWTYRGEHLPPAALERYFTARLLTSEITRTKDGMVTFDLAQPKDDPKAPPITLRITRLMGAESTTEVYIRQTVPGRERPSQAEAEALMRKMRENPQ
jgi:hypothetical protein